MRRLSCNVRSAVLIQYIELSWTINKYGWMCDSFTQYDADDVQKSYLEKGITKQNNMFY